MKNNQEKEVKDVIDCIKEYYGEELSFDDERVKAAYYFFFSRTFI